jgi:molybdenum cofactor cytidylyltransferase
VTAAVLLCAGGSTRFGGRGHKLLTDFRGRPLAAWAVEHALEAGLEETIVVVGSVDLSGILPDGVVVVENPDWADGQASSLAVGVDRAARGGHLAAVIGLGDQPLVPASAWSAVAARDSPVAVASFGGRRRPPVRLARSVWPLLPSAGDEGARALMRERPDLVSEVPCEGEPFDIDTVEDFARWS